MKRQPDGIAGEPPHPEPLRSVSPSLMELLRACTLSALWTAQRVPRALPQSPAGRLGIVAHKLLEEAGEDKLATPLSLPSVPVHRRACSMSEGLGTVLVWSGVAHNDLRLWRRVLGCCKGEQVSSQCLRDRWRYSVGDLKRLV